MKKMALMLATLFTLTMVLPVNAKPDMFLEMQCVITEFILNPDLTFEAHFEGVAGGPNIRKGRVSGVDYGWYITETTLYLNVYYTVTDKDGENISVHVYGESYIASPGRVVFGDVVAEVIDLTYEGVHYPTDGKFEGMEGTKFRDEGFVSSPNHGGRVHAKWFWDETLNLP